MPRPRNPQKTIPEIPIITFEPASIGRNPKAIARVALAKGAEVDDKSPILPFVKALFFFYYNIDGTYKKS